LMQLAGPNVTFPANVSDADMALHFAKAEAFLFASFDDFGVVSVEALAAGTPVIAYKAGGALDYVVEGKTGLFFAEQSVDSLVGALEAFPRATFDHAAIRADAQKFSAQAFAKNMQQFIQQSINAQ
jgi:glycosyltransferase involved in cell wall biosynthesis